MSDGRAGRQRLLNGLVVVGTLIAGMAVSFLPDMSVYSQAADEQKEQDPAAWGTDHVGQSFPEYMTGDECLFCHRTKIGPTWQKNVHQRTVRRAESDDPAMTALAHFSDTAAEDTAYLLGSKRLTRFLRKSSEYGKLELHSVTWRPQGTLHVGDGQPDTRLAHWDAASFADRCAGCHTTAVDSGTGAFAAVSLDCFTCHGDVSPSHTDDVSQVLLSTQNRDPRAVVSICCQCHLRGGTSRSTGRPWPTTFIAGDNLFRDYEVGLSDATIADRPMMEQHVYRNARDVAVRGDTRVTCVDCHDVHGQNSEKHRLLPWNAICGSCHDSDSDDHPLLDSVHASNQLANKSRVCDY